MSATPSANATWYPEGIGSSIVPGLTVPLQANAQIGQGQNATFDASGNAALNDGTKALLIAAGQGVDKLSATDAQAGNAKARMWAGMGSMPFSTGAGDSFTAADIGGVPGFIADENTWGRLSNSGGNDRSFGGVVFGTNDSDQNGAVARILGGPIGSLLARMLHALNAESGGVIAYAQDASASTDLGSLTGGTALLTIGAVVPRRKVRGVVTGVEIIPSAALAAAGTNYRKIQFWKVDTTGGVALASSPLVATFDTSTQALVAGQPTAFTLGAAAALLLRETDILAMTSIHTASGATVPQSAIRANFQVI